MLDHAPSRAAFWRQAQIRFSERAKCYSSWQSSVIRLASELSKADLLLRILSNFRGTSDSGQVQKPPQNAAYSKAEMELTADRYMCSCSGQIDSASTPSGSQLDPDLI